MGVNGRGKFAGRRQRESARDASQPSERTVHGACGVAGQEPVEAPPMMINQNWLIIEANSRLVEIVIDYIW
jgi:hypothetical protein